MGRIGGCIWAAVVILLAATPALAATPGSGPEHPQLYWWFRNDEGPGPEAGVMDARVIALAEALGDNRVEECRALARALAREAEDPELRQQAVEYLIESYLAEGDFAGAREAAKGLSPISSEVCDAMLTRVNQREATYHAELEGLQRIASTTRDSEEAAWAQLEAARVHEAFGRVDTAAESYWNVVRLHPGAAAAGEAICRVAQLRRSQGDQAGAIALCELVLDLSPDSEARVGACHALSESYLAAGDTGRGVRRLRQIAATYPGTQTADMAIYGIGGLYLAAGMLEAAEREWVSVMNQQRGGRGGAESRSSLENLRYEEGGRAFREHDYPRAARWWERLLTQRDLSSPHRWSFGPPLVSHPVVLGTRQYVLFSLGQCYEELEQRDEAERRYVLAISELEHILRGLGTVRQDKALLFELSGLCYFSLDEPLQALGSFRDALENQPSPAKQAELRHQMAKCYDALGQVQRAADALRHVIQQAGPQSPMAETAQRFLVELAEANPDLSDVEVVPPRLGGIWPRALWLVLRVGERTASSIRISGNATFRVIAASSGALWARVRDVQSWLDEGGRTCDIQLAIGPMTETGSHSGTLLVENNDPAGTIRVPIAVEAILPIQVGNPGGLWFGRVPPGERRTVRVTLDAPEPFDVEATWADHPELVSVRVTAQHGHAYSVEATLLAPDSTGRLEGAIVLSTNMAAQPRVSVPFSADVR